MSEPDPNVRTKLVDVLQGAFRDYMDKGGWDFEGDVDILSRMAWNRAAEELADDMKV